MAHQKQVPCTGGSVLLMLLDPGIVPGDFRKLWSCQGLNLSQTLGCLRVQPGHRETEPSSQALLELNLLRVETESHIL